MGFGSTPAKEHYLTIAVMGCRVNGPGKPMMRTWAYGVAPPTVNLKKKSVKVGSFSYDAILARLTEELNQLIAERP